MEELKRGQIRKIIDEAMRLAAQIGMRDTIDLDDIYRIAEAVEGRKLTSQEKKKIAAVVRHNYTVLRKKVLIV